MFQDFKELLSAFNAHGVKYTISHLRADVGLKDSFLFVRQ